MVSFGARARTLSTVLLSSIAAAVIGATPVSAQYAWEYDYGSSDCDEIGYNGVTPVVQTPGCAGGGFIAVGATTQTLPFNQCGATDVYIVRTNAAGVRLWEFRYDIGNKGTNDIGYSVKQVPDGFIITGTTMEPAPSTFTDIFLLKIRCDGTFWWSNVYGSALLNDEPRDLIIAKHGNANGANPGDIVVAGWTHTALMCQGGRNQDGYLLRTDPFGIIVWSKTYDGCEFGGYPRYGCNDFFTDLVEADKTPAGLGNIAVGDIVAAGGTYSYTQNCAAWAVRVNGNTGAVALPTVGVYGGVYENAVFHSVTELTVGAEAGNMVYAGESDFYGPSDIYVVKSGPKPCTRLAERTIGDRGLQVDVAYDVVERTKGFSHPGLGAIGYVFLTGKTNNGQVGTDAFLLWLAPLNLGYRGAIVYGDHADLNDIGYSLMDDDQFPDPASQMHGGFVICGLNTRQVEYLWPDELDLYLLKTDRLGRTGCEQPWAPDEAAEFWYQQPCRMPCVATLEEIRPVMSTGVSVDWDHLLCQSLLRINNDGTEEVIDLTGPDAVRSFPNPVVSGKPFTLQFTPDQGVEVTVSVTDVTGRSLFRTETGSGSGQRSISIDTDGWPAGTYMVQLEGNGMKETVRMVVVE